MLSWYAKLERFWFEKLPQKLRFLLVGGMNTFLAYLIFSALYFLLDRRYGLAVTLQYVLSINISILTMRYYVFRSHGPFLKEYAKAAGVYAYMLLFNFLWLWVFVETLKVHALLSQALYLTVSTVITFFLHKYFSFRKS